MPEGGTHHTCAAGRTHALALHGEEHLPSASMTTPLIKAASAELGDTGPLPEALDTEMWTRTTVVWDDGAGAEAGIWSCTPGNSRWKLDQHEVIYVIDGRMTVTRDGAEPVEVGPGTTVVFEKGWQGTWLIHETLIKSYVLF